jgi:hypothetical protein
MVEDLSSLGLDLFAERARTMTGNRPVDKLMGGIRFKESICLLGPMKGGKTSLAHSIITDFIKMSPENRATFVSYEEPAAQQIPKMYVSFMNKYKLDDLNGKKFSDMPAVIQKDLQVAATYVNQRINFVDMSGTRGQGHGGPAELQQCLMSLHEAGRLGKLVVRELHESPHPLFPQWSQILDLTKSEDELLNNMKSKTRYNIGLARKKGVVIKEETNQEGFEIFAKLYFETCKRQKYHGHNINYHRTIFETLKDRITHIFIAFFEGSPLAAYEIFTFNDVMYYPYGGSSLEHRNLMAPNLLMWEVIRYGKKIGCKTFDMWGSLPPGYPDSNPWSGFTRFKEGYGAEFVKFVGSFDLVINPTVYYLYNLAEKFRRKLL